MLTAGDVVAERFEVLDLLGEGGMARVYRVRHLTLGGEHALKLLTFQHPRLQQRLLREGQIQAQLAHPNVVKVIDVVEHDGQTGLLMEYVDCVTLDQLLTQRALLFDEAIRLLTQILAGVTHAHDAGILHRDLKPANVLLAKRAGSAGFIAKVTDFGIAKILEPDAKQGMTRVGALMGTPGYMAPEQARDSASVDARADVFALGVIAYETIAGFPPYIADDVETAIARANDRAWLPLNELVPDCPVAVAEAVQDALAADPEDRFADAHAFATALLAGHPELLASLRAGASPGTLSLPGVVVPTRDHRTTAPPSATATVDSLLGPVDARRPAWFIVGALGAAAVALLALLSMIIGIRLGSPEPASPSPAGAAPSTSGAANVRVEPPRSAEPAGAADVDGALAPEPATGSADEPVVAAAPDPDSARGTPEPAAARRTPTPAPAGADAVTTPAPAEPPSGSDAANPSADAVATPEAEVGGTASEAPEAAPPPAPTEAAPPSLVGRWSGSAANRPLMIEVTSQRGGAVQASITILVGPTERTDAYAGTIDAEGRLHLEQSGGAMTIFDGALAGSRLSGTYQARGARRVQEWSASRE
ncbi:MAG: serine/threonine protein kinase [Myxococcota bacterium]|jgi:serine/threonine protein kinase